VTLILHEDGQDATFTSFAPCGELYGADAWEATLTIPSPGLYFYHFSYNTPFGEGSIFLQGAGCGMFSPSGAEWQLTVYDGARTTPDWPKGGILYQVFPDRFCKGAGDVRNVPADRILHQSPDEELEWRPDGAGKIRNNDYYGGNLAGVTEKLDYLASLGVTMLYLNPIFEAHESHRYNTADYTKIDPLLGSEADFRTLCAEAKKRGMHVILDGVFSHTGADSVYFNREKRYGDGGAFNDENSPYRPWYTFTPDGKYKAWWGIDTLPEVNEEDPSYIDFICGENGIAAKWLRAGASGWRLDVADELPDDFIEGIKSAVTETLGADGLLMGEVWEDASHKISYGKLRRYFLGTELDCTMNYPFLDAVHAYLLGWQSAEDFAEVMESLQENYPPSAFYGSLNLVGSHDRPRVMTVLGEAPDKNCLTEEEKRDYRLSPRQRGLAKNRIRLMTLLQMTLPGVPCIYYGDEAGLEGYADPYNRGAYPWGREDGDLKEIYRKAIGVRKADPVFTDGTFTPFACGGDVFGFCRDTQQTHAAVLVNRSSSETHGVTFPAKGSRAVERLNGLPVTVENDRTSITLPPMGSAVIFFE
jgi:4-alpha-glucanotransferase